MVDGVLDVLGDVEAAAAVAGDSLHGDVGDGETAGHHAPQGEGGAVGQQLRGEALVAGIEHPLHAPGAAHGGELEAGGGLAVRGGGDGVGLHQQIAAGAAVLQAVGRAADQRPHLLVAGVGGVQRDLAAVVRQAAAIAADGIIAAVVIGELEAAAVFGLGQTGEIGGQRQIGASVGGNAVIAVGQGRVGVFIQHRDGVRRLVDVQAGVDAELHIAGAAGEVGQRLAGDAVLVGGVAGHPLGGFLGGRVGEPAALGINGLDDLGLALVLEAAQRVEGAEHHAGGAAAAIGAVGAADDAGAVVDAAAPEHVPQGQRVVLDVKGGYGGLEIGQQVGVGVGLPEILLGLGKFIGVGTGHLLPDGVEVAAVAGGVGAAGAVCIGAVQRIAHGAVERAGAKFLQPADEGQGRTGIAGEHIDAVGLAAGVAGRCGDLAGIGAVARFVILAQIAQTGVRPVLAGGHQTRDQQPQRQCGGQRHGDAPFHPFHRIHPAFCSKSVRFRKSGAGPSPLIYITSHRQYTISPCRCLREKWEKHKKEEKFVGGATTFG